MRARRKRGQLVGQLFLYILGIITVGLLLLLGFRAIDNLQEKKCVVQETRFTTSLATAFDENKGRGVSRVEEFTAPCGAEAVCFVARDSTDSDGFLVSDPTVLDPFGVIVDSVQSGIDTNVWVRTGSGFTPVSRFEVAAPIFLPSQEPIRCVPVTDDGIVRVRFKGRGLDVEVEDAPRSG